MDEGELVKPSTGELRKGTKTRIQSPDYTGRIKLQRRLLQILADQMNETKGGEVFASGTMSNWNEEDDTFGVSVLPEKGTSMSGRRKKRSTGKLTRTGKHSGTFRGTMRVQRHTLRELASQMNEIEGDELTSCVAAWKYGHGAGLHFVFELSPFYPSIAIRPDQNVGQWNRYFS